MGCRRRFCRRPLPERLSTTGRAVGPSTQGSLSQSLRRNAAVRSANPRRRGLGGRVRAADAVAGRQETVDQIALVCL